MPPSTLATDTHLRAMFKGMMLSVLGTLSPIVRGYGAEPPQLNSANVRVVGLRSNPGTSETTSTLEKGEGPQVLEIGAAAIMSVEPANVSIHQGEGYEKQAVNTPSTATDATQPSSQLVGVAAEATDIETYTAFDRARAAGRLPDEAQPAANQPSLKTNTGSGGLTESVPTAPWVAVTATQTGIDRALVASLSYSGTAPPATPETFPTRQEQSNAGQAVAQNTDGGRPRSTPPPLASSVPTVPSTLEMLSGQTRESLAVSQTRESAQVVNPTGDTQGTNQRPAPTMEAAHIAAQAATTSRKATDFDAKPTPYTTPFESKGITTSDMAAPGQSGNASIQDRAVLSEATLETAGGSVSASSSPVSAETNTTSPTVESAPGRQVREQIQLLLNRGEREATIRLHPEELGSVRIQIKMDQGQIQLKIIAEQTNTQMLLQENAISLRQELGRQGILLGDVEVTLAGREGGQRESESQSQQGFTAFERGNQRSHEHGARENPFLQQDGDRSGSRQRSYTRTEAVSVAQESSQVEPSNPSVRTGLLDAVDTYV